MEEVGGALVAIALVLSAVFIPSTFLTGILGQFFRQFAVTIATATVISLIVSLTLSPALCALLFKPHEPEPEAQNIFVRPVIAFFNGFNRAFEWISSRYGALTGKLVRISGLMVVIYAGLIALTAYQFVQAPTGFIPQQDQGYLINIIQLAARRLAGPHRRGGAQGDQDRAGDAGHRPRRADRRPRRRHLHHRAQRRRGVHPARRFQAARREGPERASADRRTQHAIRRDPGGLRHQRGAAAGARHRHHRRLQDGGAGRAWRRARGARSGRQAIMAHANQTPGLAGVFTTFSTRTPKVYADIDRVRAEMLGVNTNDVFQTLEVFLGSQYVNDFNFLGRTYRVTAQADGDFRQDLHAIGNLKTRNAKGEMVPLSSVASFRNITGPYRVEHFNLFPSAAVQGGTLPGYSTGYGLAAMEKIAQRQPARRLFLLLDRARLSRRSSPATRPSTCSWPRWCSCSCCSPRNMRAGRCRSP